MARHWDESVKEDARALYGLGYSIRELQVLLGASYNTVRSWVLPKAHAKTLARMREQGRVRRAEPGHREQQRVYHADWYARNKDKKLGRNTEWKEQNPVHFWAAGAVSTARQRAKRKSVPFSITTADVLKVFPVNGKCPVFGTEFVFQAGYEGRHLSPSLDRIRPELGYVVGNIAVISNRANMLKGDASSDELLELASWLNRMERDIS